MAAVRDTGMREFCTHQGGRGTECNGTLLFPESDRPAPPPFFAEGDIRSYRRLAQDAGGVDGDDFVETSEELPGDEEVSPRLRWV